MESLPPPPPKRKRGRPSTKPDAPTFLPDPSRSDFAVGPDAISEMLAAIESGGISPRFAPVPAEDAQAVVEYAADAEPEPEPDDDLSMLERDELRGMLAEIARRQQESLRLFVPREPQRAFLESRARERLVRGGNRGGKTLVGAIMCALCVTGRHPHAPKRGGKFIVVGKDLKHCGSVIFEKLFKPGAFKIIKDPVTREWRTWNPAEPWDAANEALAKDAPPLIPSRYVKSIAWENKKDSIPKSVNFRNDWKLEFYSGEGAPRQGIVVDVAWFDEEIPHPDWYKETRARIIDRKGFFYWTATPQAGTLELYRLYIRAGELAGDPDPAVSDFLLTTTDNHYLGEKEKREFIESIADEDERRIRIEGDFALLGARVYPTFAPKGVHGCPAFPIPRDWTRYVAIDPGRQFCAILFCAVPPPTINVVARDRHGDLIELGRGKVFVYDELYIKKCDAAMFAKRLKAAVGDQPIYSFIIDQRAGRQHEIGSGATIEDQYSSALKRERLACERTGSRFIAGHDDVKSGIESVRLKLTLEDDGRSKFLFFAERLGSLIKEMDGYSYKKVKGVVTDEPIKLHDHLCDTLRYLASANLKYIKARPKKEAEDYTSKALREKSERAKHKRSMESGHGTSIRLG